MKKLLLPLIVSFSMLSPRAQISVSGVAARTIYSDRVSFTIRPDAGYDYAASLNGGLVPVGTPVVVTNANYYELKVQRSPAGNAGVETVVIPFIVRSSARGSSETGLPPWTPLPIIPSATNEFSGARLDLLAPRRYPAGMAVPLVAWVRDENGRRGVNAMVRSARGDLILRRGVGSILITNLADETSINYAISLPGIETNVVITLEMDPRWQPHSGTLLSDTTWGPDARIAVPSLTVPSGVTLTIEEGAVVQVAPGAEIHVSGTLRARGTMANPVVFAPKTHASPWGGIELRDANARLELAGTILTGGGQDPDWFDSGSGNGSSHRDEQPMLFANNGAHVSLIDSAVIRGSGQAGHGENGFFTFTRTLIQGFTTAGQYNGGSVTFVESAAVEFPSDDDRFADADNDGFYLTGGAHAFTHSLVGWTKDDGIDAGSGSAGPVRVEHCWVESCYHEGFAWSETRTPTVIGSVALNCGQGIEAGFGTPNVLVSNSLSTANLVGARFGDNYDWDYDGFLRVTNSWLLYNDRDVWGMNWDDWTYRVNQMDIAGNHLTQSNPNHPNNELWDARTNAADLARFLPAPGGRVGAGIALRSMGIDPGASSIPVRLSSFATNWVSVDYAARDPKGRTLPDLSGTLMFPPGQTVQRIPIRSDALAGEGEIIRIDLLNPTNAELTGLSRSYLVRPDSNAFETLVPLGSVWRYPDPSGNLGTAWRSAAYNDSAWRNGRAELGNGDGDEATTINIGPQTRFPTIYFRHSFAADQAGAADTLFVRLKVDDGAIIYLNGQELFRANMPSGPVSYSTLASSSLENAWFTHSAPGSALLAGTNLLAVEVHQQALDSSDLSFDLELRRIPPPRLDLVKYEDHLVLHWTALDASLQESPSLEGPWRDIPSAGAILETAPTESKRFFRLRKP